MKTRILWCCLSLIVSLALAGSAMASMVSQGKCLSYDEAKKIIVMEEYDTNFTKNKHGQPTGKQSTYDASKALIGVEPKAGDILRIAYTEKDGKKVAIRVMNVTRQDIMKK
jgi:hypothetical protein